MIRLMDVIIEGVIWHERFAGQALGYYHILAIDYVKEDVLFRHEVDKKVEYQTLNGKASHLKKWFRWYNY